MPTKKNTKRAGPKGRRGGKGGRPTEEVERTHYEALKMAMPPDRIIELAEFRYELAMEPKKIRAEGAEADEDAWEHSHRSAEWLGKYVLKKLIPDRMAVEHTPEELERAMVANLDILKRVIGETISELAAQGVLTQDAARGFAERFAGKVAQVHFVKPVLGAAA